MKSRWRNPLLPAASLAAVLFCCAGPAGCDRSAGETLTPVSLVRDEDKAGTEARLEKIAAELAKLDRSKIKADDWAGQWAGGYSFNGGPGTIIIMAIAPKAGFAFLQYGCCGLYKAKYGDIVGTFPGGIEIKPAAGLENGLGDYLTPRLYFVPWHDRKYLVPETSLLELVINYNAGESLRGYCRVPRLETDTEENDGLPKSEPAPPGRPQLPPEFARRIIEKRTPLRITGVTIATQSSDRTSRRSSYHGEVELAGGTDRGLFVGTQIGFGEAFWNPWVTLTTVDETRSVGTFDVMLDPGASLALKVGAEIVLPGADPEPSSTN